MIAVVLTWLRLFCWHVRLCVELVNGRCDYLHTVLCASSFSGELAWLSAKMSAHVTSSVRRIRTLLGVMNYELTCDLLGDQHWNIEKGELGALVTNVDERTFGHRVL